MESWDPTVTLTTLNRCMVTVYIMSTFVVICRKHAHCIVMHFSGVALWPWVLEVNSTKAAACDSKAMYLSSTSISKRYVLLDGNRHI